MKSWFSILGAIVMIALYIPSPVLSQGEPDDCGALCVCVTDATCTSATGCDPEGCVTSTSFTLNCTSGGTYKMDISLTCTDCQHCFGCAYVFDSQGNSYGDIQTGCVANQCSQFRYVTLEGGKTYKLLACWRMCPCCTCEQCAGCTVRARIYRFASDCDASCTW